MSFGKAIALTVAFVGVFALGVVSAPYMTHRPDIRPDRTAAVSHDAVTNDEKPATAKAPKPRVSRPAATASAAASSAPDAKAETTTARVSASTPELRGRLKKVLRSGAQMDKASEGFASGEQFALVAHASRNTDVPFMLLKHRVVEEGKSLQAAIHESKPDIDAAAAVAQAREQARADLAAVESGN